MSVATLPTSYEIGSYRRADQARAMRRHLTGQGVPAAVVEDEVVVAHTRRPVMLAFGAATAGWIGLVAGLVVGMIVFSGLAVFGFGLAGLVAGGALGALGAAGWHAAAARDRSESRRYVVLVDADRASTAERLADELG